MINNETNIMIAGTNTMSAGTSMCNAGTNSFNVETSSLYSELASAESGMCNTRTNSFNAETSSLNSEVVSCSTMSEEETYLVNSYVNRIEKKKYPVRRSEKRDSRTTTTPEEDVINSNHLPEQIAGTDPKRIDDMNIIASKLTDLMERRKKKQQQERGGGASGAEGKFDLKRSPCSSAMTSLSSVPDLNDVDGDGDGEGENDSLFSDTSFDESELQGNMKYFIDVMTSGVCEEKDREHLKTIILYERIVSDMKNEVDYLKNLLEIVLRCKCT